MRSQTILTRPSHSRRSAFTLIELMVVIAIIAGLMVLSASAVIKYLSTQKVANTQNTLDRTQSQLNKAWSKEKDDAYRAPMTELVPGGGGITVKDWVKTNLASVGATDANADGRTRVIYVKLRLRRAFPMNFNEALNPFPLPALPAYTTYLTKLGITGSSNANYESSVCLLMALQRGVSGAGIDPSDLTKGGATGAVPTPNGGNLQFLTDAWYAPIYFSRFPVGSIALNPAGAQPGANDPGDPQGYLQTPSWGTLFGPTFSALTLQQLAPGNTSYKLAPQLASSGMDGKPQFNVITFAPTLGSDDLFSNP